MISALNVRRCLVDGMHSIVFILHSIHIACICIACIYRTVFELTEYVEGKARELDYERTKASCITVSAYSVYSVLYAYCMCIMCIVFVVYMQHICFI